MIGTYQDAKRAVEGKMPLLANGTGRRAFHDPDSDVVYKVEWGEGHMLQDCEARKWAQIQGFDLPEGLGIPDLYQYDVNGVVVNAMTFVDGTGYVLGYEDDERPIVKWLDDNRICDTHSGNVLRDRDGIIWIVDLEI